jgi:hypothetical protein
MNSSRTRSAVFFPALALILGIAFFFEGRAHGWELEKRYKIYGYIESDLRLSLPLKDAAGMDDYYFVRSENTFRLKGALRITQRVKAVADFKLVLTGMMAGDSFDDLSYREKIDPFRIENDALFLQVIDFLLPGLDFRLGRQIVIWGTADKFNPTSNLNALDLEDPIKFGDYVASEMINVSFSPPALAETDQDVFRDLVFQFVVVPIFRPAQLPTWTKAAFTDPDLFEQRIHADEIRDLLELQRTFNERGGIINYDVHAVRPDINFKNVQLGMKLAWTLLNVDMSVSYYRGFWSLPVAERVYAHDIHLNSWPGGSTTELIDIIRSVDLTGVNIDNVITISYPRMQVFGADFATSIDKLGGLGLWGEVAFYLHPERYYHIRTSGAWAPGLTGDEIYLDVDEDKIVEDIKGNWFFKVTAGVDYSIFYWWYINVQYMHGFVDEWGMNDLSDYLVAGSDFKLFAERLLLRMFTVISINPDEEDYSVILYPEMTFSFWQDVDFVLGGLFHVGDRTTKYGSPLAGPSMVFLKGKVSI